ncbi:COFACTOR ASSEMBLY OF COMPLEX C SUBUNIT B CCB2, chloroplastic-like protein [Drosera capensis]
MKIPSMEFPSLFTQTFPFPVCFLAYPFSSRNTITRPRNRRALKLSAQINKDSQTSTSQQQLNLSVLRFTFGVSWLDESYLPRWIGYGLGALILLNHFLGSNSPVPSAQLVSEALGLSLAAFSATLPYLGKFLKGASQVEQTSLPEGAEQIFVMSENIGDGLKPDLAWATYVLLRNTNSVSVLICVDDVICVRGYWSTPDDVPKVNLVDWFKNAIKKLGLSGLRDTLYFPGRPESELEEFLPKGIASVLIQPVVGASKTADIRDPHVQGFLLLASTLSYAYSDKDRSWIRAVSNKFRGRNI